MYPLVSRVYTFVHFLNQISRNFQKELYKVENTKIKFIPNRNRLGYFGPRALPGHGIHRYWFHLYALDEIILSGLSISCFDELIPYLDGHVIASAHLEGLQVGK
jgi:phosphatidylethanolamine-binding protein (PEBP) family uncharacterized protein